MQIPSRHSIFWPSLCAFFIALGFVFFAPGDIRKDAYEYDSIARSIVAGEGFSFEGKPTMLREPGYPFFRAAVYFMGGGEKTILLIQAVLAGVSIFLLARALESLNKRAALFAAWTALLAYSFFSFTSRHLAEVLIGFLCSLLLFLITRVSSDHRYRWFIPFVAGVLCLTRFSFLFVALISLVLFFLLWSPHRQNKKRGIEFGLALIIFLGTIFPWSLRNHLRLDEWSITSRVGTQVYARAWKAQQSWRVLGGTYLSVLGGKVFAENLGFVPIIDQQWRATAQRFTELHPFYSRNEVDRIVKREGIAIILSSKGTFARALSWSSLELLRFLAFPSPFARDFSIEGMFYPLFLHGGLTPLRIGILILAHGIQLCWIVCIFLSQINGFKYYGLRWFPGILILATALAYLPFDVIIRYAYPIHPWMLASIAFVFWDWILNRRLSQGATCRLEG